MAKYNITMKNAFKIKNSYVAAQRHTTWRNSAHSAPLSWADIWAECAEWAECAD